MLTVFAIIPPLKISSSFNSSPYSDLTLLVGPSRTPIHVHQIIVCSSSYFFKNACSTFTSSSSSTSPRSIPIPDISVSVLQSILSWQYGGKYTLPAHHPPPRSTIKDTNSTPTETSSPEPTILATLVAASYLQIPLIQSEIFHAISEEFRFRPWQRFPKPVEFIDTLCNGLLDPNGTKYPISDVFNDANGHHKEAAAAGSAARESHMHAVRLANLGNRMNRSGDKAALDKCVSTMVASHNFQDLANEIEQIKRTKLENSEGATRKSPSGGSSDREDPFFTIILPAWEEYVRKRDMRRVLDPVNEYAISFDEPLRMSLMSRPSAPRDCC
ncbi:hypothetical protein H072_6872 [Dactylellina haptotyla CBS 200.50]|uniref:BTB domain-containing protein n=1 Tax=Dactylellina haptotyla (strain CBS 200.50) TaxID=1284197 RepID=S8BVQ3_DACHA|nr:hypothetical protein H072_6872 [Dactylellina haptotyla CBS 200.50]